MPNYCNADGDIANGCETYVFGNDTKNCGGCGITCDPGQQCNQGECVVVCNDGKLKCGNSCLDPNSLHIASCDTCTKGYADADGNILNGCEINLSTDVKNCGEIGHACKAEQSCDNGICTPECDTGTICNGKCLDLGALHLASCTKCAAGYSDTDNNLSNGCEKNITDNDNNNCGSEGNKCGIGQQCKSGKCEYTYSNVHRVFTCGLGGDTLNVRSGAGTSNAAIGELNEYVYVKVLGEKDGWFMIDYKGKEGWISGTYTIDAGDKLEGRKAIDHAEKFLYNSSTKMCTWDYRDKIGGGFEDLWKNYGTYNHGYNDNCANFVTSCLKANGLISKHFIAVSQIINYCGGSNSDGYRQISASKAKAGDVWVNDSGGHTELVMGYLPKNGSVILIGSNNFNSSNFTGCQLNTGASGSSYQRVSYASSTSGRIYSRQ